MPKELREIKNRYTGQVIHSGMYNSVSELAQENKANLNGANLTRADLTRANLTRADLNGANLNGANLNGADLNGANLNGADLNGANLYGANLNGADLNGAELYGAKYGDFEMSGEFIVLVNLAEFGPMFCYIAKGNGLRIVIGCRHFSALEARKHWKKREDRPLTRYALVVAERWAEKFTKGGK